MNPKMMAATRKAAPAPRKMIRKKRKLQEESTMNFVFWRLFNLVISFIMDEYWRAYWYLRRFLSFAIEVEAKEDGSDNYYER